MGNTIDDLGIFWVEGQVYTPDLRRAKPQITTYVSSDGSMKIDFVDENEGFSVGCPSRFFEVIATITRGYYKGLTYFEISTDELDSVDLAFSSAMQLYRSFVTANNDAARLLTSLKTEEELLPETIKQHRADAQAAADRGVDLESVPVAGKGVVN